MTTTRGEGGCRAVSAEKPRSLTTESYGRWIARLTLSQFRNYTSVSLAPGPAPVVLTGANGAGKTNILEAVSLLSPGRGLRGVPFLELRQSGSTAPWAVSARLQSRNGETILGTGLSGDPAEGERAVRLIRINGEPAASSALAEYLRIVWLTPALDGLFTGPAAERRRFLDRMTATFTPGYRRQLSQFERATRQRNRLLEMGGTSSLLDALELQMAESGVAIAAARMQLLEQLNAMIAERETGARNSAFPAASLEIDGTLETSLTEQAAVDVEDGYLQELARLREIDRAAKRTTAGPHRSDLLVYNRARRLPARLCSTGEQKALLAGLVLAHAELVKRQNGSAPIILLDEIAAHLDEERRAALFAQIEALEAQAWLTGTDREMFAPLEGRAQFFVVHDGKISAEPTICANQRQGYGT